MAKAKKSKQTKAEVAAPCPWCLDFLKDDVIDCEAVQPLRGGALDSLAPDGRMQCRDCGMSYGVLRIAKLPSIDYARTAMSNHRRESMRLPGVPFDGHIPGARLSEPGELESHWEWLDKVFPDRSADGRSATRGPDED